MNVLVTGATGNVGGEITKALAVRNVMVRAGARNPAKVATQSGVTAVLLDYDNPETFGPAMAGMDGLALLSPPFSPPNEVEQAAALVQAARQAGVRHIARLSLMGAPPESAHSQVEKLVEASGMVYTHLRPNFFMQNYHLYYGDDIKNRNLIYLPSGDGKQSLIDTRDIGEAFAVVFTEPGHTHKAYELTGSEALDHTEIAAILSKVLRRTITYPNPSAEEYRQTMKATAVSDGVIATMIRLYGIVAQGWAAEISPDLPHLLGHAPHTFTQYATDYAHHWQ